MTDNLLAPPGADDQPVNITPTHTPPPPQAVEAVKPVYPKGGRPRGSTKKLSHFRVDNVTRVIKKGPGRGRGMGKKTLLALEIERASWFRNIVGDDSELTELQWQALKQKVLMGLVQNPTANSSAALNAMKEMDKQRQAKRMGTRKAVEETRDWCKNRLNELAALERWAEQQGVSATTKAGSEHPAGQEEPKASA